MSSDISSEDALIDSKESVNSIVLLNPKGWLQIDGPFAYTVDGWQAEIAMPISEDDYGAIKGREAMVVKDGVGEKAVALADGEVEMYGEVVSADEIDGKLLVAIRNISAPERGDP